MQTHESPPRAHAGAMAALREATAEHHERLERRMDVVARLASVASYRALLERLHGFHAPAEALVEAHAGDVDGLDLHGRRKAALLLEDIRALGGTPGPPARGDDLPAVTSADEALGVLYVLEGSTLGGAVIARMARARLGVTRTHGAAFLGAYGATTGSRWRAFGAAVKAHTGGSAPAAMCEAAIDCFTAMERWLCR